jgi:anti-sigma B factor antagonist
MRAGAVREQIERNAGQDRRGAALRVHHRRQSARHTIAFAGVLDLSTASTAARVLLEVTHAGNELVLDLSELSFLDTIGLRTILICRERCLNSGCSLTVASPSAQVRRLLQRLGLLDYLTLPPAGPGDLDAAGPEGT